MASPGWKSSQLLNFVHMGPVALKGFGVVNRRQMPGHRDEAGAVPSVTVSAFGVADLRIRVVRDATIDPVLGAVEHLGSGHGSVDRRCLGGRDGEQATRTDRPPHSAPRRQPAGSDAAIVERVRWTRIADVLLMNSVFRTNSSALDERAGITSGGTGAHRVAG